MKITIDTTNKTIEIEERITMKELKKALKGILAEEMDEYFIVPKVAVITSTIVYPPYYVYPVVNPIYNDPSRYTIYCGETSSAGNYDAGRTFTLTTN